MSVLPRSRKTMIEWFESRLAARATDPPSIGLTPEQVTSLGTRVVAARNAFDAFESAQATASSSTPVFHDRAHALRDLGGELIKIVKACAEATGDATVYDQALVPPDASPSPAPPPAIPTDLAGRVTTDGGVELTWSGSLANGVLFQVERRLTPIDGPASPWSIIGAVQTRSFEDVHVPTGLGFAAYRVIAKRDAYVTDPTAPIEVLFGSSGPVAAAA